MKKKEIMWEACVYEFDDFRQMTEEELAEIEEEEDGEDLEAIPVRLMNTPIGVIPIDDQMNPFRNFEFWKGSTNFDVTQNVVDIIKKCEGVESLVVISRYTFMIGIGRLFNFSDVRLDIEKKICGKHSEEQEMNNETKKIVSKVFEEAELESKTKNTKYWCAYIFPNGKSDIFHSNSLEEYKERLEFYNKSKTIIDGIILSYDS